MTYYKWTGKITKIGKKENPSSYARIPKYIMTENGLKQDGEYNFTIEECETKQEVRNNEGENETNKLIQ